MAEVMLGRAPIDPAKVDRLTAWFDELHEREAEVIKTLEHEGVYTESAFLQASSDTFYLYVYMEADDLEKADEAGDEEKYRIDEEHHEVLSDVRIGDWEMLETIGHFTNPHKRASQ